MPAAPTTPEPVYTPNSLQAGPSNPVPVMDYSQKARYRAAAARAKAAFPGAIGELLYRELLVVDEFGWALGVESFSARLLRDVEASVIKPHIGAQSVARGDLSPT
jgi:hypothetical protein